MKIQIIETGYYDTTSEKCRLLKNGDILEVLKETRPAPCKSKGGNGVWTVCGAFVEDENYKLVK